MSVINDLSTDQRVHKHCLLLHELGFEVLLIGRTTYASKPLDTRPYLTHRMHLPFERGPLFYASFNVVLFFHLLFRNSEILFSNDLDTLLPNFLVARLKRKHLIYDSHECFTEVPELVSRPKVQAIWRSIERWILPKLTFALTVNASIAELYKKAYGIDMKVLRNMPKPLDKASKTRKELGLPEDKKIVILQGSGINMHRGSEEAVEAMRYINNAVLLIIGSGDVLDILKRNVKDFGIEEKVIFKGRMPYAEMMAHTQLADLGLTLDKDTNINYRYSLPNKVFDYIQAGIPVLGSDLVEVKRIVQEFSVGQIVESVEPKAIALAITNMLSSSKVSEWKANCIKASKELNLDAESKVLREMIIGIDG